ncbi:uncharacterized protein BX664DRAFT_328961 [Halteromyces radiatus]|uniref:uncharacterized protein n=1 Tax=Halteromyces radiatus TaxID=101107 RepID=UPI00221ED4D5|nr:uncharacterized protein BX664DRAFT_328961 [Halteromyces radiatus]KAI8093116.1 hypothetical protein BX664DRAFT_328961 [Halteromyces radiatus]
MIHQSSPTLSNPVLLRSIKNEQDWSQPENEKILLLQQRIPELIKMSPSNGMAGTVLTVWVQYLFTGQFTPRLAFNTLIVDTKMVQSQGVTTLVATVPTPEETGATGSIIPIYLCLLDKDNIIVTWPLAEFTFDSNKMENIDQKSTTLDDRSCIYNPFYQSSSPTSAVTNYSGLSNQQELSPSLYGKYAFRPKMSPMNDLSYNNNNNNNNIIPTTIATNNIFPTNSGFTNVLTGNFYPTITSSNETMDTPRANVLQYPYMQPNTIQSSSHFNHHTRAHSHISYKTNSHVPTTSLANYQPYPSLTCRTNLHIIGNMDSIIDDWSPEEWRNKRRLVRFYGTRTNHDIRCMFEKIPPTDNNNNKINNTISIPATIADTFLKDDDDDNDDKDGNNNNDKNATQSVQDPATIVSCIYWQERNDWFITSVDCIQLLEHLMDSRFSVEEKNRVRRNLEGFRPVTVSKCKAESADFFKLIMSFPNPKPRNIEKDLKVFPWKALPYALKKIITKYTATSYGNNSSSGNTNQAFSTLAPSSLTYPRRSSAPSRDHDPFFFNNNNDNNNNMDDSLKPSVDDSLRPPVSPTASLSSPARLSYQQSRPLSTPDAMATYRFRLPPMDDPSFPMADLMNNSD